MQHFYTRVNMHAGKRKQLQTIKIIIKMKKYSIALVAMVFALSTVLVAQQPQRPNQKARQGERKEMRQDNREKLTPQKRAGYMAVNLELTDAQRKKLEAYFEKQEKQVADHRAEMEQQREQHRLKAEEMRKAHEAEMEKILGTEKYTQHKAEMAERTKRMKERRAKMAERRGNNVERRGDFQKRNTNK